MSDHAKLAELIDAIEAAHPEWVWLARSARPGSPLDPAAKDKYLGSVTVPNGNGERVCHAWGPSSHAALQAAYADALKGLN